MRDVFAVFESIAVAQMSAARMFTFVGDYARAIRSFKAIQVGLAIPNIVSTADGLMISCFFRSGCSANRDTRFATGPLQHRAARLNGHPGISSCSC